MWQALCFSFFLIPFGQLFAQKFHDPFALAKGKPSFIYGLDNRSTHLYGQSASIFGVYSGIGFKERKLRFKIGLNASQPFSWQQQATDSTFQSGVLAFVSIGEEMEMFRFHRMAIHSYFNIGLGYFLSTKGQNLAPTLASYRKQLIAPLEIGLVKGYDITRYLTLKVGGGWRFMFPDTQHRLSGLFLKLSAQFRWSDWKKRKA
jgi:hypothetical protein